MMKLVPHRLRQLWRNRLNFQLDYGWPLSRHTWLPTVPRERPQRVS